MPSAFPKWFRVVALFLWIATVSQQAGAVVQLPARVSTHLVAVPILISGFNHVAVLINNTNLPAARWQPFQQHILVDLGPGDGTREVCFFLAQTNGAIYRIIKEVVVDTTPLRFVLDRPTNQVVTLPFLDLVGHFTRYAESATATLSNAQTNSASLEVLIVHLGTRDAWPFLPYSRGQKGRSLTISVSDAPLTPGTNTVTVRARDQDGHPFTSNLVFVLDYSRLTNAPRLTLLTPRDGASLSGDSFSIRGYTDDPGATVTARITTEAGTGDMIEAEVETSGIFWFDEVPLARSNRIEIVATNARQLTTMTNFTITKAAYRLVIDPVSDAALLEPWVRVTGRIDVTNHTVWINGVRAAVKPDGTWAAERVPVPPSNTAIFEATAIPNSENGGLHPFVTNPPALPPAGLLLDRNVPLSQSEADYFPNPQDWKAYLQKSSLMLVQSPTNLPPLRRPPPIPSRTWPELVQENAAAFRLIGVAGVVLLALALLLRHRSRP